MKRIPLSAGQFALVDDDLFEKLSKIKWWSNGGRQGHRARGKVAGKDTLMHRYVLRLNGVTIPKGMVVDHINRDPLDNRACNLRVTTQSENCKNVSEERKRWCIEAALRATKKAATLPRTKKQIDTNKALAKKINALGLNILRGKDSPHSRLIRCTESGRLFYGYREAADAIGMNYSTLRGMLSGYTRNKTKLISVKAS